MHRAYRLTEKQDAKLDNEAHEETKAKKSRLDSRISIIVSMDNGTMVEAFKYLNYCQLATNSLVSMRFRNVIKTHRHKLALLYVNAICMGRFYDRGLGAIKIFKKELSPEEYNEWVVRNNCSKQMSLKRQAGGNTPDYQLSAYADYKDPNQGRTSVFFARVKEIDHKTWPLFEHFIRLLTDSFIYISFLGLNPQADVLELLTSTIDRSNRGRLQCENLHFVFEGDIQDSFSCIKDHMRCASFQIAGSRSSPIHDKQLLDFFATGSHCASEIIIIHDHISKDVIIDLVQKFMNLKSRNDSQLVQSIGCYVLRPAAKALMSNYEQFFIKEEDHEYGSTAVRIYEFINVDIAKKMQLAVTNSFTNNNVILKIINL